MKTILKCVENIKDLVIDYEHAANDLKTIFRNNSTFDDKLDALDKLDRIVELMNINLNECREIVCYQNDFPNE